MIGYFVECRAYPQWEELQQQAHQRERQAFAPGTYKNLQLQWTCFLNFCAFYDLQYAPAEEETLVLYLKFLELNESPKSVQNYLFGVKTMHHWLGFQVHGFKGIRVKHMLRAIFCNSTHVVKQASPITPQILADIRGTLNLSEIDHATFWAACVLSFMLMLRKSNFVPSKKSSFDASKQLSRGHIKFVREDAAWVTIVWSKTLQFRLKELRYPLLRIHGSQLCPVWALQNMLRLNPQDEDKPLFCRENGEPWTYSQFARRLRIALEDAGYQAQKFSCHSFRHGGCTFCFEAGIPEFLIQVIGDWKSDVYKNYCRISLHTRTQACSRFRLAVQQLKL